MAGGMQRLLLLLIRFYQRVISPLKPRTCRFHPTCSHYAYQAVDRHGALVGGWLAARRILRCHPLNPGGYDPVPEHVELFLPLRKAAKR